MTKSKKTFAPKIDIYQSVTDRIVAALEAGTAPWLRPWKSDGSGSALQPFNALSGRPYSGINLLVLGCAPFASLGWVTYKQAIELGGSVRAGEKGTSIVFWKFDRTKDEETGEVKVVPFARGYTVFNVDQCDGIEAGKVKAPIPPVPGDTDINALAARVGAVVRHGGDRAFFSPSGDFISIPSAESFNDVDNYASTLAHELTHWSGGEKRLNRQFGKRFGDEAYAFEELVAEIGSAFLCAANNIPLEGLQHPAYVANWLEVLKGDKRAIFTASSQATKAAKFLLEPAEADEEEEAARIAA